MDSYNDDDAMEGIEVPVDARPCTDSEALAVLLGLPADVVAERMRDASKMGQFTVVQLKKLARFLSDKHNLKFKACSSKKEWLESIQSIRDKITNPLDHLFDSDEDEPSHQNTSISTSDTSHLLNTSLLLPHPLSFQTPDTSLTLPANLSFHTTEPIFQLPQPLLQSPVLPAIPRTPRFSKPSRKFSSNSPLVQHMQSPLAKQTCLSSTADAVGGSSSTPFRNPLLFRALNSPTPSKKANSPFSMSSPSASINHHSTRPSNLGNTTSTTAANQPLVIALGRSIQWKPTSGHYANMAKLVKQIPAIFHTYHDFSHYIHSESKLATRSGRVLTLRFFLTKPVCEVMRNLTLFVQTESSNIMLDSEFGVPMGTVTSVKVGDGMRVSRTAHTHTTVLDLSPFLKDLSPEVCSAATDLQGPPIEITLQFPTARTTPIHALVIACRDLDAEQAALKICQHAVFSQ
ncbi:hypothetical protein HDU98_009983, partial [Podochytrium sp. JEL0797]